MVDSSSGESFLGELNSDVTPKRPGKFLIYIYIFNEKIYI